MTSWVSVDFHRRFGGTCYLFIQSRWRASYKTELKRCSDTLVCVQETTRCRKPQADKHYESYCAGHSQCTLTLFLDEVAQGLSFCSRINKPLDALRLSSCRGNPLHHITHALETKGANNMNTEQSFFIPVSCKRMCLLVVSLVKRLIKI